MWSTHTRTCLVVVTGSRTEAWSIWHHRGYNVEKQLCLTPDGVVVDLKEMCNLCCGDTVTDKLRNIEVIQGLDLTYEETVVLGCIAIMSPGT